MNRRMFEGLGPTLARRGNRAICVDLLGHGRSDQPDDLRLYSMPLFAEQVVAVLDHLGLGRAVVGGTSLGANVALDYGYGYPPPPPTAPALGPGMSITPASVSMPWPERPASST